MGAYEDQWVELKTFAWYWVWVSVWRLVISFSEFHFRIVQAEFFVHSFCAQFFLMTGLDFIGGL